MIRILSPATDQEWRDAEALTAELKDWDLGQSRALGLDADEVARFFYPYDAQLSRSTLLLAMDGPSPVGCAAYIRLDDTACELHSVYVRPARRGVGIAGQLVRQLVEQAREAGYRVMRLETATFMGEAQKLYAALGFRVREPYRSIPPQFAPYTIPMEFDLG
jgi:putative acetyltransferase